VTDITEHPTREGKPYCAVVLDACSRRVVGWSIDVTPTAALVTNALGMAIQSRKPAAGTLIHSDQGVQRRFKGSLQRRLPLMGVTVARRGLRREFSSPGSCGVGC
jgi:transposase InsO family protein